MYSEVLARTCLCWIVEVEFEVDSNWLSPAAALHFEDSDSVTFWLEVPFG